MLLHLSKSGSLETNIENKAQEYTVSKSAKQFRVLADALYSDKIGSISRELASNAFDAHLEVGNTEPFEVHLPTTFEPYFAIRDYGTGIAPEKMYDVYCQLFESTKDGNNNGLGGFGLGSKTPFSYTDAFTVTNYYQGQVYAYVAAVNEYGIPTITLMGQDVTTEPNGLYVQIAVAPYDFQKWKDAARSQLSGFKIKPKMNVPINWINFDDSHVFGNVHILKTRDENSATDGIGILLGPIYYALTPKQINDCFVNSYDLKHFATKLGNIVIHAPIGSVDVTPSRESVQLNARTINFILQSLSKAQTTIKAEVTRITDANIDNPLNMVKELENFISFASIHRCGLIPKDLRIKFDHSSNPYVVSHQGTQNYGLRMRRRTNWIPVNGSQHIMLNEQPIFLINDKSSRLNLKAQWLEDNCTIKKLYIVDPRSRKMDTGQKGEDGKPITVDVDFDIEEFKKELFITDPNRIFYASKIEVPKVYAEKVKRAYVRPPKGWEYRSTLDDFYFRGTDKISYTQIDKFDPEEDMDGIYFISVYYKSVDLHLSLYPPSFISKILRENVSKIRLLREKDFEKLEDSQKLTKFIESKWIKAKKFRINQLSCDSMDFNPSGSLVEAYDAGNITKTSPIGKMIRLHNFAKKLNGRGMSVTTKVNQQFALLQKNAPLLLYIDKHRWSNEEVLQYNNNFKA